MALSRSQAWRGLLELESQENPVRSEQAADWRIGY